MTKAWFVIIPLKHHSHIKRNQVANLRYRSSLITTTIPESTITRHRLTTLRSFHMCHLHIAIFNPEETLKAQRP